MPNICQRFCTAASESGSGKSWNPVGALTGVLNTSDGYLSSSTYADPPPTLPATAFTTSSAYLELAPGQSSKTLKLTNFQFGQGVDPIPSGATILAIEVRAQCKYFNGDNPGVIYKTVRLVKGPRAVRV